MLSPCGAGGGSFSCQDSSPVRRGIRTIPGIFPLTSVGVVHGDDGEQEGEDGGEDRQVKHTKLVGGGHGTPRARVKALVFAQFHLELRGRHGGSITCHHKLQFSFSGFHALHAGGQQHLPFKFT